MPGVAHPDSYFLLLPLILLQGKKVIGFLLKHQGRPYLLLVFISSKDKTWEYVRIQWRDGYDGIEH